MKKNASKLYNDRFIFSLQGMLDFDYVCRRDTYSVNGIIDPFGGSPRAAFYWGSKQVFIPSKFDHHNYAVAL